MLPLITSGAETLNTDKGDHNKTTGSAEMERSMLDAPIKNTVRNADLRQQNCSPERNRKS